MRLFAFIAAGEACHGAHGGEGPVLAGLAMLAALCVAAGGSAPPVTSVARRGDVPPGRDGKAGSPAEPESRICDLAAWARMDFPPRSEGFANEPDHPRRAGWRRSGPDGGSRVSSRRRRSGA